MSTRLYLECVHDDVTYRSGDEVGQHLAALPRIRRDLAIGDTLVELLTEGASFPHFTMNAAVFLADHPDCPVRIVDEYGGHHPARGEEETA